MRARACEALPLGWEGVALMMLLLVGATASVKPASSTGAGSESGQRAFYVAPDGNDAWSGRLLAPDAGKTDGPFATIARARDAVRRLKAADGGLRQPATVFIRGGTSFLREPMVLTPEYSGTGSCPI